jgi:hypothetical protein
MDLASAIISITVSLVTLLTSLIFGVRWLVKHYFDEIKHELKPNSGKSLKDQVNRMEVDLNNLKTDNEKGNLYHEKLDAKIDHLTTLFIEFVSRQK